VSTNIVTFRHDRPAVLLDHLRSEGVLAGTVAPRVVRLMTHHDVDDESIERATKALSGAP
jgi:threonine aldolase